MRIPGPGSGHYVWGGVSPSFLGSLGQGGGSSVSTGGFNPNGPAPGPLNSPVPIQNPLGYVSPQAAVAAGLNPAYVYRQWKLFVCGYSSPQAAVAAGIPPGVVTQLWEKKTKHSRAGVPPWLLIAGAGVLVGAMAAKGNRSTNAM